MSPLLRSLLLTSLGALSIGTAARADTPARATREGEDVSAPLEELRAKLRATGVVALALQDGEVAAWGAAGVRAFGSEAPITIDDPVHLGSCAKAMTATLVARLVEDEVLSWDTTIAEALPELAKTIDAGFHGVTVEQLLRHLGGIAERRRPELGMAFLTMESAEGSPPEVRLAVLEKVLASPPLPPPEGGFDYSNYGYMTVGAMVQARTGKPWSELMAEKVFRPLKMESAGVWSPAGDDVPVGHTADGDGWKPLPPGPGGFLPDAMGPAGLVHSNLADWGRFVADHIAGERGEDGLVTAKSYKRLHRVAQPTGYACGWGIARHTWSWGEGTVFTHNGSDNTWHSVVFAMPEWDLVVLAASNCAGRPGEGVTTGARDLLLETLGFKD